MTFQRFALHDLTLVNALVKLGIKITMRVARNGTHLIALRIVCMEKFLCARRADFRIFAAKKLR